MASEKDKRVLTEVKNMIENEKKRALKQGVQRHLSNKKNMPGWYEKHKQEQRPPAEKLSLKERQMANRVKLRDRLQPSDKFRPRRTLGGDPHAFSPKFGTEKSRGRRSGGKFALRRFESTGAVQAAVKDLKTGQVGRGLIHYDAYEDLSRKIGKTVDEVIDLTYDPTTDRPTGRIEEGFSRGREGRYVSRTEEVRKIPPKQMSSVEKGLSHIAEAIDETVPDKPQGEAVAVYRREQEKSMYAKRAEARAEVDPTTSDAADKNDQYRRRMRAKKAQMAMRNINTEIKSLEAGSLAKSPAPLRSLAQPDKLENARLGRLKQLVGRKGLLSNIGRKAGVFSFFATPYTTGEALIGLANTDRNERLRSVETLFGIPDFSTGRGLSDNEKKEKEIWFDPTTGEGKI